MSTPRRLAPGAVVRVVDPLYRVARAQAGALPRCIGNGGNTRGRRYAEECVGTVPASTLFVLSPEGSAHCPACSLAFLVPDVIERLADPAATVEPRAPRPVATSAVESPPRLSPPARPPASQESGNRKPDPAPSVAAPRRAPGRPARSTANGSRNTKTVALHGDVVARLDRLREQLGDGERPASYNEVVGHVLDLCRGHRLLPPDPP